MRNDATSDVTRRQGETSPLIKDLSRHLRPRDADTLVQSAGRGIQAALGTLFDRTAPVVYGAMRRVLHSPTEAAQATMNIYVELWRTARRCPPAPDSAHAFLAGLARAELIRQHHGIDRTGRPSIDGTHEAASSRETAQIRSGGCRALS